MTTKQRILSYLQSRSWCSGTELESQAPDWGTKASVITRRARELVNEGKLDRMLSNRKTVQYRLRGMSSQQANAFLESLDKEPILILDKLL